MTLRSMSATLVQEVHPDLNGDLDPESLSAGSNKKIWWRCSTHPDHEWQATVYSRSKGSRCPFCTNMRIKTGFNDLQTKRPELAAQWHPSRNGELSPAEIGPGTSRKVWWLCTSHSDHLPHEWEASVVSRARGAGCPFCAGKRRLEPKVRLRPIERRSLAEVDPDLAAQWHPVRNGDLTPSDLGPNDKRLVWWLCDTHQTGPEHAWQASVNNRHGKKSGCPFCAGKKVLAGFNDLATTHKSLAAEWVQDPDAEITPHGVTAGSNKPLMWRCSTCQHEWSSPPKRRTTGHGCPACAGRLVLAGHNDVLTKHPELAAQWHHILNGELRPEQITVGSRMRVWWQCPDVPEHVWDTRVFDRVHYQTGCPHCFGRDSASEREFTDMLEQLLPEHQILRNQRGLLGNGRLELDVWIPELNTAIEFNGVYWHSEPSGYDRDQHREKLRACRKAGIRLIVVWSDDWLYRREIVTRMLAHKLGVTDQRRFGARTLQVRTLDAPTAREFLTRNHLQGPVAAGLHLGLVDKTGTPQAVLSVKSRGSREPGTFEIVRYATSTLVPGGFQKLLTAAERQLEGQINKWVTFADLSISDGGLYERSGFTHNGELEPDYSYRVGDHREHKSVYRVSRFRTDPGLQYQDGLTERQLAELNGLARVWDYGKIRYMKQVRTS